MSDLLETLSIFIPTYNRANKLGELLNQLNLINHHYCCVNVIDNCSEDHTKEVVDSFRSDSNYSLNYLRNEVNVGLSGNLIKCIENCKTDWLWIIGDDDLIDLNAFKILSEMNLNLISNDTIYINFSTPNLYSRKDDFISIGLDDFVLKLDSFSNLVFISSSLINVRLVKAYIRFAYLYSNTLVPHISMILCGLSEKNFKIVYSKQKISVFRHAQSDEKWSYFNYYKNLHSLLDFFSKSRVETYNLFRKKILKTVVVDSNYLKAILLNNEYNLIFKKHLFNNVFFQLIRKATDFSLKKKTHLIAYYCIINFSFLRYLYISYIKGQVNKNRSNLYFQPLNSRI